MGCGHSNPAADSTAQVNILPEPMAAFLAAAARNDTNKAKRLMAQLGSLNTPMRVESLFCRPTVNSGYFFPPLMLAAHAGNDVACRLLVKSGADVNKPELGGRRTPLMFAVSEGHECVVRTLLESGADVNQEHEDGQSALAVAMRNYKNRTDIFRLLLRAIPNVNCCDRSGNPPLVLAARHGSLGAIRELLARGALVDHTGHDGRTPLVEAAARGHAEAVELLLQSGAAVNKQMHDGRTALRYADTVEELLDGGADANRGMKDGSTIIARRVCSFKDNPVCAVMQKTVEMAIQYETLV